MISSQILNPVLKICYFYNLFILFHSFRIFYPIYTYKQISLIPLSHRHIQFLCYTKNNINKMHRKWFEIFKCDVHFTSVTLLRWRHNFLSELIWYFAVLHIITYRIYEIFMRKTAYIKDVEQCDTFVPRNWNEYETLAGSKEQTKNKASLVLFIVFEIIQV